MSSLSLRRTSRKPTFDRLFRRGSMNTPIAVFVVVAIHETPESGPMKKALHRIKAATMRKGLPKHEIVPGISGSESAPKTTVGISTSRATFIRFVCGQWRLEMPTCDAVKNDLRV